MQPSSSTLFVYSGTAWLNIAGGGGGGGTAGVERLLGGDGVSVSPTAGTGTVTASADIDTDKGLEIASGSIAINPGAGLEFDASGALKATATALAYRGTVDLTGTTVPAGIPDIGDSYSNTGDGNFSAEWLTATGLTGPQDADPGDLVVWNGTVWTHIPTGGGTSRTDLSIANRGINTLDVASSTGDDATIPAATTLLAGLMTAADKDKLDDIETGASNQNLSYTADGQNAGTVTITDGTDATIPVATSTTAGLFTGTEKDKLDDIEAGASNQDLDYTVDGQNAGTVTITDGTNATIPIATSSTAGLFTGTEKDKLDDIEAGASNQDLDYTTDGQNAGTVTITDGTDATIPIATSSTAGLFTGTEKDKLAALNTEAQNDSRYLRIDAGTFDQTVASTGDITFSGLTEHADGLKVEGGDISADQTISYDPSFGAIKLNSDTSENRYFRIGSKNSSTGFSASCRTPTSDVREQIAFQGSLYSNPSYAGSDGVLRGFHSNFLESNGTDAYAFSVITLKKTT